MQNSTVIRSGVLYFNKLSREGVLVQLYHTKSIEKKDIYTYMVPIPL